MFDTPLPAAVAETSLGFAGVVLAPAGIRYATLFHATREGCVAELRVFGGDELLDDPRRAEVTALLERFASGDASALGSYPVDLPEATPLQRRTWLALRDVPAGETRSYGWLANHIGEPGKARIVGAINGANPVPLWLPCHRIIGANGDLVGFGGGLAMKRRLLELEGALPRTLL